MQGDGEATTRTPVALADEIGLVVVRLLVLLALVVWVFWPELKGAVGGVFSSGEWSHGLVAPGLILLLAYRRRHALAAALTRGSAWGFVVLVLGLGLFAANLWPFDFTYLRLAALVPVCAGALLAVAGWRVLRLCVPMLVVLLLSLPIGPRQYASLTLRLEMYTTAAARIALDVLPGVAVTQDGPDLNFTAAGRSGTVALGEPRRGAGLLVTYLVLGVFVTFARVRPAWQVAVMALLAVPIVLLCNLARLVAWGLIEIYGHTPPGSAWPRVVASLAAVGLAFGSFLLGVWTVARIVEPVDDDEAASDGNAAEA